jgi:hypothetical protein
MATTGIYTYDALDLEIRIAKQLMQGWGDSDFVTMAYTGDTFEEKIGADGIAYRSRDRTGTTFVKVTLTLMAASPMNSFLTALHKLDILSNSAKRKSSVITGVGLKAGLTNVGTFPMEIKFMPFAGEDGANVISTGREILVSHNAFIKTTPEIKGGKSISTYEWTIMATAAGTEEHFNPHGMYYGAQDAGIFSSITSLLG